MKLTIEDLKALVGVGADQSPLDYEFVLGEFDRLFRLQAATGWEKGWSAGLDDYKNLYGETIANPYTFKEVSVV